MSPPKWMVHKFGGTSVATADCLRKVAEVCLGAAGESSTRQAVVVSAMGRTTNKLLACVKKAKEGDSSYVQDVNAVVKYQLDVLKDLVREEEQRVDVEKVLHADQRSIEDILRAISLCGSVSRQMADFVAGFGELWTAQVLNVYLGVIGESMGKAATWLDARKVLYTSPPEAGVDTRTADAAPSIAWERSERHLEEFLDGVKGADIVVVTGFICRNHDGTPATLQRNGSDFSASIFGKLLRAESITIWTDVDGVYSADPRRVPEAVRIDRLSYDEAAELAFFGAKVLHPHTMAPAISLSIPICIKSTFNPESGGTVIGPADTASQERYPVKGFTTVDPVAVVNVEGNGMIGVPGISERLFAGLKSVGISVIMISQASSEHSICFCVPETQGKLAKETLQKAFFRELHHHMIDGIQVLEGCCVLAAVGDRMRERRGIAQDLFAALAKALVNVRAVAQGASERNISVLIDRRDAAKAIRSAHATFFLSRPVISVGIVVNGTEDVGERVLQLIQRIGSGRKSTYNFLVRGLARNKEMVLLDRQPRVIVKDPEPSPPSTPVGTPKGTPGDEIAWRTHLKEGSEPFDIDRFGDHVAEFGYLGASVVVDCTMSLGGNKPLVLTDTYKSFMEHGNHVVTNNERVIASALGDLNNTLRHAELHKKKFVYGNAMLPSVPLVQICQDLSRTGRDLVRVEGMCSCFLTRLLRTYTTTGQSLGDCVRLCAGEKMSVWDVCQELSGNRVARKALILARMMGYFVRGMDNVMVQSLLPQDPDKAALANREIDDLAEYLNSASKHPTQMQLEGQRRSALEKNQVLTYCFEIGGSAHKPFLCSAIYNFDSTHNFAHVELDRGECAVNIQHSTEMDPFSSASSLAVASTSPKMHIRYEPPTTEAIAYGIVGDIFRVAESR